MIDGHAASAYFPDDGPMSTATEVGASASRCDFDCGLMRCLAGDAAVPRDANIIIRTDEVQCCV